MLGLWVNLEEELPNYLEEDNIGITTVAVPDGNGYKYIVYDGTNADEMTGSMCRKQPKQETISAIVHIWLR